MIVSTIKQFGFRLRADPEEIPFQYSANVKMKFEKDENYNDYTVVGYYIPPGENEAKILSINDDCTFILGPDCFKQRGTLSFSFNLINSQEEIHLGSIDFEVRYAFGDGDTILPESEEVWISLVTKVAKDAIREDVKLVKQKANEALQSASLANDKASEAEEYANNANQSAGSASLSASSALTAKNNAIAASNSAIQAKQDAEQSANNAKNSADDALKNANASNKAIETVTQIKTEIENKANDFDTNYQEKLKSFNDNATSKQSAFDNSVQTANTNLDNKVNQANSDLDVKVQEANTIIDEKVKTATEQAQKATDEANRAEQATDGKLDKNLGAENAGKSLVIDENGEVVCGESGINEDEVNKIIDKAIDEKLYTQEEVDYMLADKMDKPYTSIEITDNATLDDCLAGNFKIDKIKGNTYQNVETDIVPTPSRPIPINSRKVKVGDKYVELRSLKETSNLFDYRLYILLNSEYFSLSDDGNGIKILKPDDRDISEIAYELDFDINTYLNFMWDGDNGQGIELQVWIKYESRDWQEYSTVSDGLSKATLGVGDNEKIKMRFKFVGVAGAEKINIGLYDYSQNVTSYIAPTIRDYKIINHVDKTAKIIRNVRQRHLTSADNFYKSGYGGMEISLKDGKLMNRNESAVTYCNLFNHHVSNTIPNNLCYRLDSNYLQFNYEGYNDKTLWDKFITDNELYIQYQLSTPTEETIVYSADDVSEVGYSWQDTTSPSPTIKSEVKPVEKIDILKTGKNLFDVKKSEFNDNGVFYVQKGQTLNKTYIYENVYNITGQITIYYENYETIVANGTWSLQLGFEYTDGSESNNYLHLANGKITSTANKVVSKIYVKNSWNVGQKIYGLQIEVGTTATPYEPYTGQRVNYTPTNPMYSTQDGSICDYVDVEKGVEVYNMSGEVVINGTKYTISWDITYKRILILVGNALNVGAKRFYVWCDKGEYSSTSNEVGTIFLFNDVIYYYPDDSIQNDNGAKEWLSQNPITVVYPLATTTEIPIPQEQLAKLKSLKTEQGVTNIFVGGEVKPTIEARYALDIASIVSKLQTKLLTLQKEVVKNV